MIPFRHGQAVQARAVELDRVFMVRNKAVLAAAEIESSLLFIDLVEGTYVPISVCDLLDQSAVSAVMIDVSPAAAIAEPKERTVFQVVQAVVNDLDPCFGALAKNCR